MSSCGFCVTFARLSIRCSPTKVSAFCLYQHILLRRGASSSAGRYRCMPAQYSTPALFRAPALLGIALLLIYGIYREFKSCESIPPAYREQCGPIQPALLGTPSLSTKRGKIPFAGVPAAECCCAAVGRFRDSTACVVIVVLAPLALAELHMLWCVRMVVLKPSKSAHRYCVDLNTLQIDRLKYL